MPSLSTIRIVVNPDQKYTDYINHKIVETEDWNKVADERGARDRGLEVSEFYVAIDYERDEAVSSLSLTMDRSVADPEDVLFSIGNFYILPEYRGMGLGAKIFNQVLDRIGDKNIVLQAVDGMFEFYERKYGFVHSTDYYLPQARLDTKKLRLNPEMDCEGYSVVDLSSVSWDHIAFFDQTLFGRQRSNYLKEWITHPDATSKVTLDSSGTVVGFGCIRPQVKNRLTVGPLYANSPKIAEILLHKLLDLASLLSFDQVWIRFPEINKEAMRLIESIHDGPLRPRGALGSNSPRGS